MRKTTFRLYGKELERWTVTDENGRPRTRQIEFEYKEYLTENGELCGAGSEDFSLDRYHNEMLFKFVWTWNGERRNAGGNRWFECCGAVMYTRKDARAVKEYLKRKYNAELVELR